jgi:hypothetical protein
MAGNKREFPIELLLIINYPSIDSSLLLFIGLLVPSASAIGQSIREGGRASSVVVVVVVVFMTRRMHLSMPFERFSM